MKILPYKRMKVADGLTVLVSTHFHFSEFGIRPQDDRYYSVSRYVTTDTPGTGFFERESESHSYHQFVRKCERANQWSYWRMVTGKEPDFDRELRRVSLALSTCDDDGRRQILEPYMNSLTLARNAERYERIIRGIKDRMGHRSNKYMVSVINRYKNRILRLERDMEAVELKVKDTCGPETYEAYGKMVEAFVHMADLRRTWHYKDESSDRYEQVFFDLGVFDYIRCDIHLPLMRDSNGVKYFLLPTSLVVARSSVDFDVVPLKGLTLVVQELAIEESVEALTNRPGDAASMIRIPGLDLTFYFNHVRAVVDFVHAVDRLKSTL